MVNNPKTWSDVDKIIKQMIIDHFIQYRNLCRVAARNMEKCKETRRLVDKLYRGKKVIFYPIKYKEESDEK